MGSESGVLRSTGLGSGVGVEEVKVRGLGSRGDWSQGVGGLRLGRLGSGGL